MSIKKGVSVLVLNKKGEVLVTQRQDLLIWVFPGGGIERGESLEQAAKREVEEETGIKIKIKRLVAVYIVDNFLWKSINFFFLATVIGGSLKRQKGEVLALRWVKEESLGKILPKRHYQRFLDAFSGDKRIGLRVAHRFPFFVSRLPAFVWRRYLGKWLGLARV